jgi:hypothetical protein
LEGLSAAIFFIERISNRTNSVSEAAEAAENPVPAVLSERLDFDETIEGAKKARFASSPISPSPVLELAEGRSPV